MTSLNRSIFLCLVFSAFLFECRSVNAQVTGLLFRPADAAYSTTLDRLILISANPNQLHIYDPASPSDQIVALPAVPQNISLSSDGTHVAIGFDNAVAYVDLQSATVSKTFSNVSVGTGKVICGAGYIYVFPGYNGSTTAINIATGQVTITNSYTYASGGTFDPLVNAIYSTENGISPNSLNRFDTAAGPVGRTTSQPFDYFSNFSVCGPLWISNDGSTIYSACGAIYRASNDPAKDMRYLGKLPAFSSALAISDTLQQIAAIPSVPSYSSTPLADTVVNLYASSSFTLSGQFATTPFRVNSVNYAAHARWVFYNSSSSAMFIVTQADAPAGLTQDFAVENIKLSNPNSCNATFGTTSVSAIAAGSYATAQILSNQDCVFTAVSNTPWITLASGAYGSGNTNLTYLVRPNPSANPRSGSISLGSATFTVNQDGAAPASALNPLSFKPVAALYDKPLDRIVMVSASPNELHVYDPVTQADQIVSLAYVPLSLSVRPDGIFAAIGHSGHISIVDLQSLTVSQTISVDMEAGGIALASNGYAYAFPTQLYSWADINSVQLSTGTLTVLFDVYYGNIPRLDASGNYLYVSSSSGASKLNISNGPATVASNLFSTLGGNIWLGEDGNRLISSNGKVFFTSPIPAQDLRPGGQLSGATNLAWADDSQTQHQVAVLTDPSSGAASNTQLQIYEANGLGLQAQTSMPGFSNAGKTYASHGKYVFWNAAASKLFAITEADSSSGLMSDFAVYTVDAPQSLPGCTYAVSPTSLNAPPSYSSWVFNVTSNCNWTVATASGSWLYTTGYGVTSGNGQFTLTVQNNSAGVRSGSISIGNQTIAINQAPSTCSYTLSATSGSFSPTGGTGTVDLSTGAGCPWSAQSNYSWLTITSGQSGTGPATIAFSVDPATILRSGSLNIAGLPFSVSEVPPPAPLTITFADTNVLARSATKTILMRNTTGRPIPTSNIGVTGANPGSFPFWTNCGASVGPGVSCSINITFMPLLVGSASAVFNIPADANGTLTTVSVSGIGKLIGAFEIVSMPTGKVLEVPGAASASNGTLIAQNPLNGSAEQQWRFIPTGDGYYVIKNVLTGKVLDVTGRSVTDGILIQQWDYLEGANQQWQLVPVDDVHYAIINRNSGLSLDVRDGSTANGAQIQQWTYLGNQQQLWVVEPVRSYNIANNLSSYVLDVPGASTSNGTLLQQWSPNGNRQQQWQFVPVGEGYYAIMNRSTGKVLDVIGKSSNPAAGIQQWDYLGGANQQWRIVPLDANNYEIVNRQSEHALDDTNFSTALGTTIQQWPYEGGKNQQWQISPVIYYNIVNKNSGLVLDVINGLTTNGTNIQQWSSNGYQQQQWQLLPLLNGVYAIVNNLSTKALGVTSSSMVNGAKIEQNDYFADLSQQWQFLSAGGGYYQIKNLSSGKVLDMTGASVDVGWLLQQWDYLTTANQQWQLVPAN